MTLITRQGKGELLTIQEMDNNLTYLEDRGLPYTGSAIVSGSLQVTGSVDVSENGIFVGNLRTNLNFGVNSLPGTSTNISAINNFKGDVIVAKGSDPEWGCFINLLTDTYGVEDPDNIQDTFNNGDSYQFLLPSELPIKPQEVGSSLTGVSSTNYDFISIGVNNSQRSNYAKDGVLYMYHDNSWNIWTNNERIMYVSSSGISLLKGDVHIKDTVLSSQTSLNVISGSTDIAQIQTSSYDAAFFDYTIKSGSNLRAGTVFSVHHNGTVQYNESTTQDIGDTTDFNLSVVESGGQIILRSTAKTNNWTIKTLVRGL